MVKRAMWMSAVVGLLISNPTLAATAEVDEQEAPESAVSSPPMALDDPATPGPQGIELNLVGGLERAGQGRGSESLFDLNYGIGNRIQLKFERPYVTAGQVGEHFQRGLGATKVGVKWRFLEKNGWQLATYPAYTFDDAFTVKDEQGNPEESEGHLSYLPLLVSRTMAQVYTVAFNFGYRHNNDHSTSDRVVGFGVGRALGVNGRVMAEVYSERDEDFRNRQTDIRVGVVEALFPKRLAKTGLEFPGYVSIGRSVGHTDAETSITSITVGVSIVKPAKGE